MGLMWKLIGVHLSSTHVLQVQSLPEGSYFMQLAPMAYIVQVAPVTPLNNKSVGLNLLNDYVSRPY